MNDSSRLFPSSSDRDAATMHAITSTPYLSDGPTLPIIGDEGEHQVSIPVSVKTGAEQQNSKQRKVMEGPNEKTQKQHDAGGSGKSRATAKVDLTALYNPWTLLPPEILKLVEKRVGGEDWWGEKVIPVVFTRNQNVKAGVNRLKAYLGAYYNPVSTTYEKGIQAKLEKEDAIISVSAQGEATTKLVGIIELVRRIVGQHQSSLAKNGEGGESGQALQWYIYTTLSSQFIEKKMDYTPQEAATQAQEDHANMDVDEAFEPDPGQDIGAGKGEATDTKRRRTPVLTVWISKKQIAEFNNAFGEQTLTLLKALEDQ